ncbi:MAG: P1 family peptidase [Gemmatimonadales bacterium]
MLTFRIFLLAITLINALPLTAQDAAKPRPRARDLGIPFDGTTGINNAITDVAGVEVGHTTLISGSGRLVRGSGPVRTGVTAILPRGRSSTGPVFSGWFALNGNGEMTGTTWITESGLLTGPVMITNTHSVGAVHQAVIEWNMRSGEPLWSLPVVAETFDGILSDINGFHVKAEHVFSALESARSGPVAEGSVGGGTGMICNGFKGGIGTSSRKVSARAGGYTVGVLVQCNYGGQSELRIVGVPVGREITESGLCAAGEPPTSPFLQGLPSCTAPTSSAFARERSELGSIIIVVATDAPLLPHQLNRLAKRASLGVGRQGGMAGNSSGDIFIAFSTANASAAADSGVVTLQMLPNDRIDALFLATIRATEEAITNAMLAADTMTGADDVRVLGLPHNKVVAAMKKFGRM